MNLKLLIAFLVLPFCGKAQITLGITGTADTSHKPTYFPYNGTLKMNTSYSADTVKCIMLVCDTSHSYSTYFKMGSIQPENHLFISGMEIKEYHGFANQLLYYQIGYEVRTGEFICCDPSEQFLAKFYWSYNHVKYLDENKKPLSKNIIVWISKNTEP